MIILPTRRRLMRRRDALYRRLHAAIKDASVHEVEYIMRKIHGFNLKLKSYFIREGQYEPAELFEDKDTFETEDPTFVQIEEAQREIPF